MSYFAAVLTTDGGSWRATEVSLDDCESIEDIADVVRDVSGSTRLLMIEQDDEYAVLARVDGDDEARVFLSDGHAADAYSLAALIADELDEIGGEEELDEELAEDAPPVHDSAPFGDPALLEDLGTTAAELLALCAHEGTLPIDVLVTVCERAGCAEVFEAVRS